MRISMTTTIRRREEVKRRKGAGICHVFLLSLLVLAAACGANEGVLRSGKDASPQANAGNQKTPFARELESMRDANFTFIYVLRRKDGTAINAEDRGVIKLRTADANRRLSSDDDKAFIIGSNVQLSPQNMIALYDRFAVENYSPPPIPETNGNANANK